MLSHGEESGRDAAERSEAPRPTEEEAEIVFSRQEEEDGEDGMRPSARMPSLRGTDRTR